MRVLALPSDRPISDLAPCFADWDVPKFAVLLRTLQGAATAARCALAGDAGVTVGACLWRLSLELQCLVFVANNLQEQPVLCSLCTFRAPRSAVLQGRPAV